MTYTGKDITAMREALGVSGTDMASLLCVHPVSIYHWAGARSKTELVGFPLLVVRAWKSSGFSKTAMMELGLLLSETISSHGQVWAVTKVLHSFASKRL